MSKAHNDDAPLSRTKAAARLAVSEADLPAGKWTMGQVRSVGKQRPTWLRDARQAQKERGTQERTLERFDLVGILEDLGYGPDPDASYSEAIVRSDAAGMAARSRWPHDGDRFDRHFDDIAASWWPVLHDSEAEERERWP